MADCLGTGSGLGRFQTWPVKPAISVDMEQLVYIAFGWLLGLLAPSIVRRIERVYRADELRTAITAELEELQHKMTFVTYKLRDATATNR